jgi:hypothetical protein
MGVQFLTAKARNESGRAVRLPASWGRYAAHSGQLTSPLQPWAAAYPRAVRAQNLAPLEVDADVDEEHALARRRLSTYME